jgi:hypothetical protein
LILVTLDVTKRITFSSQDLVGTSSCLDALTGGLHVTKQAATTAAEQGILSREWNSMTALVRVGDTDSWGLRTLYMCQRKHHMYRQEKMKNFMQLTV